MAQPEGRAGNRPATWRGDVGVGASLAVSLRITGPLVGLAVVFFVLGGIRTAQFGSSIRMLVAGLVMVAVLSPFVACCFLGLGTRRMLSGVATWSLLSLLLVEGFAQAQERAFQKRHRDLPELSKVVVEARWWPFEGNVLIYVPAEGEWLGDC